MHEDSALRPLQTATILILLLLGVALLATVTPPAMQRTIVEAMIKLVVVAQIGLKASHKGVEAYGKVTLELSLFPAFKFAIDIAPGLFPAFA